MNRSDLESNSTSDRIVFGGGIVKVDGKLKIYDNISSNSVPHWHQNAFYQVDVRHQMSNSNSPWVQTSQLSRLINYQDGNPEISITYTMQDDNRYYPAEFDDCEVFSATMTYSSSLDRFVCTSGTRQWYSTLDEGWELYEQEQLDENFTDYRNHVRYVIENRGIVTLTLYGLDNDVLYSRKEYVTQEQQVVTINATENKTYENGQTTQVTVSATFRFKLKESQQVTSNSSYWQNLISPSFNYVDAAPLSSITEYNNGDMKVLNLSYGLWNRHKVLPGKIDIFGTLQGQTVGNNKVSGNINVHAYLAYVTKRHSMQDDGGGGVVTANLNGENSVNKITVTVGVGSNSNVTDKKIGVHYFKTGDNTSTHITNIGFGSNSVIVSNSNIKSTVTRTGSEYTIQLQPFDWDSWWADLVAIDMSDFDLFSGLDLRGLKLDLIDLSSGGFITPHNLESNPTIESNGFTLSASSVNLNSDLYYAMDGNNNTSLTTQYENSSAWFQTQLENAKRLHQVTIISPSVETIIVQASNDGNTFTNICTLNVKASSNTFDIQEITNNAVEPYVYWRLLRNKQGVYTFNEVEFQFDIKHTIWQFNPSSYAQSRGYNHYENSFLDQYINNSTSNFIYQPQTRWSKESNSLYMTTNKNKGLLYGMDADFCKGLLETEIPVNNNGIYPYDNHSTIKRKVFIPSLNELGGPNQGFYNLGTPFAFFSSNSTYTERRLRYGSSSANGYWTRTIRYINNNNPFKNVQRIVKGSQGNPPGVQGYDHPNGNKYFCPVTRWGTDKSNSINKYQPFMSTMFIQSDTPVEIHPENELNVIISPNSVYGKPLTVNQSDEQYLIYSKNSNNGNMSWTGDAVAISNSGLTIMFDLDNYNELEDNQMILQIDSNDEIYMRKIVIDTENQPINTIAWAKVSQSLSINNSLSGLDSILWLACLKYRKNNGENISYNVNDINSQIPFNLADGNSHHYCIVYGYKNNQQIVQFYLDRIALFEANNPSWNEFSLDSGISFSTNTIMRSASIRNFKIYKKAFLV